MNVYSSGLYGVNHAQMRMMAAASNVSRSGVEGAKPMRVEGQSIAPRGDVIELSSEFVEMNMAEVQQGASLKVLETASEMDKTLIDIFA